MRVPARLQLLFFIISLVPGLVVAETGETGEDGEVAAEDETLVLWRQGMDAWHRDDIDRALTKLRQSYSLDPVGRVACVLGGLCSEQGWRASAALWLERCAGDDDLDEEQRRHASDEVRYLLHQVGAVEIPPGAVGSTLVVDGEERGSVEEDSALLLPPGPHDIRLTDREGRTMAANVEVLAGRTTPLRFTPTEEMLTAERRDSRRLRIPFWACVALTASTAIGFGVALGLDVAYHNEGDPRRGPKIASGVLGVTTALGLASILTLLPYIISQRREARANLTALSLSTRWSR